MSQYTYCIVTGGLVWLGLYCNTIYCIVTVGAVGCWTVSRHGQPGSDTAQGGAGRWARGALGTRDAGRARGVQARGLGAPGHAGWAVDCALGALSLFFTQF